MSIWVLRGLRDGVVTTRWPRAPRRVRSLLARPSHRAAGSAAPADPEMSGAGGATTFPDISGNEGVPARTEAAPGQPTSRRSARPGRSRPSARSASTRDGASCAGAAWRRGRTCSPGRRARPGQAAAAVARQALVVPTEPETDAAIAAARAALAARTAALRRSVHVRHVDAGSDGSEEWEIQALLGPVYDIHRLGIFFTASPRHADVLLVTGAGTAGMTGPLRTTYDGHARPEGGDRRRHGRGQRRPAERPAHRGRRRRPGRRVGAGESAELRSEY